MSIFQKIIISLAFIFLVLLFSLPLIRSGLTYDYGIGYWGPNGHDMIWHQSLINHITNPFSIPIPSFSGNILNNYHPFYNILISTIFKITSIPINILIFQVFPIISSFIYIYLSFYIGKFITKSSSGGYLLALANVIASSAGFIVTLINEGKLAGESIFWSMQSASLQLNPPLVLSLIFLQLLLIIILKNKSNIWVIALLVLLPITKAYAGVAGYLLWSIFAFFSYKSTKKPFFYLLLSLPISYTVFRIYNTSSASLFEFNPLWFIDQMINSPDKIYLPRLSSALYNLKLIHSIKVIPIYFFGIFIFILGNYFWRLLGIIYFLKNKTVFTYNLLLTSLILFSIPLLFTQRGTAWNTIQFIYYSLFLFNILLVLFISSLKNRITKILLIFAFVITSLLTNLDSYKGNLGNPPPSAILSSEIKALKFLSTQPAGIVLTYPFDNHLKDQIPHTPIPLYAYTTSSYIPAFTPHTTYISDEMNLNNSGYDWKSRLSESSAFFKQLNPFQDRGFLVNNRINYIYLTDFQINKVSLTNQHLSISKIYDDGQTLIYKVNR